jgi:1-pyrroline-5-carboxylate dehydrogenase
VHGRDGRRAPFGGFNMSGTDSKAGGYDYLLLFLQAAVDFERQVG